MKHICVIVKYGDNFFLGFFTLLTIRLMNYFKKYSAALLCCTVLFSIVLPGTVFAQDSIVTREIIPTESVNRELRLDRHTEFNDNLGKLETEEPLIEEKIEPNVDPNTIEQQELNPPEIEIPELPEIPEMPSPEDLTPIASSLTDPIDLIDRVGEATQKADIEVVNSNGSASYSKNLYLPPGRNGFTPSLSINYDSGNKSNDSIVGFGWNLSQYYISLNPRYGVDKMYETNEFVANTPLDNAEIIDVNLTDSKHGIYGAKIEVAFQKYEFLSNDTWKVTDKNGTQYFYGQTAASRQDDPNDSTRIYKWMLDEIRDTNGNWIKFDYYKDSGQIYPRSINYTGNGIEQGLMTVKFQPFYNGPSTVRNDNITKYTNGFETTTNYILDNVEVEINGKNNGHSVLRYDFDYTTSTSNKRSLLTSFTQVGIDENGVETALPSTEFAYSDAGNTSWVEDTNWTGGCIIGTKPWGEPNQATQNRLIDRNYDGLLDCGIGDYNNNQGSVNTGSGFDVNGANLMIPDQLYYDWPSTAMMEVNGDGKVDFVESIWDDPSTHQRSLDISGTNPGFTNNSIPTPLFKYGAYRQFGFKFADFNGDGLTDLLQLKKESNTTQTPAVWLDQNIYINNGVDGWDLDTGWQFDPKMYFVYNSYNPNLTNKDHVSHYDSAVLDYNNDGLTDVLIEDQSSSTGIYVYLNNGNKGFEQVNISNIEPYYLGLQTTRDFGIRMVDLNSDGMTDWLRAYEQGATYLQFKTFDTKDYVTNNNFNYPVEALISMGTGHYQGVELADLNGDGMIDIIQGMNDSSFIPGIYKYHVWLNQGNIPDMLVGIDNNRGGQTTLEYKNSPLYRDTNGNLENPNLHLPKMTLNKVTYSNDFGDDYIAQYNYEDGEHIYEDSFHNEFGGFHVITKTDNLGIVEKTYYHQGGGIDGSAQGEYNDHISKKGKPYRIEIYKDNGGALSKYTQTLYKWEKADLGNQRYFPKMTQQIDFVFNVGSSKASATSITYDDNNGNIIEEINLGEVNANANGTFTDVGSDTVETQRTYASPLAGLTATETVLDGLNNKLKEVRYYYDNLPLGQATVGNQTSVANWHKSSEYYTTQYVWDGYGNVIEQIDPLGNSMTANYKQDHLYIDSLTNALGQSTDYDFNYLTGNPSYVQGPNNNVIRHYFDSIGRHIRSEVSDPQNSNNLSKIKEITYNDQSLPNYSELKLFDSKNDTTPVTSRSYFDGRGNVIQNRSTSNTPGTYIVTDNSYDAKGQVTRESLPYFTSGTAYQSVNLAKPANLYTYDVLGRIKQVSNALGTTSTDYNLWNSTITDPLNNQKDLIMDAYGRLVEVHEHNGADEYITHYEYTPLGLLSKITDHYGNLRTFTYDGLGRLTMQTDFHLPADTSYSKWSYIYDQNSNLLTQSFGDGSNIRYYYDQLNRPLREHSSKTGKDEVTYTYDTAPYGTGLLASITKDDWSNAFEYDINGNVTKETTLIKGDSYVTNRLFDLQGKITRLISPDNKMIRYAYNDMGLIDNVYYGYSILANNLDYTPLGQMSHIEFSNGAVTDYDYPESDLFRLGHITTTLNGQTIQDLDYTYDALNNLTHLVDNSQLLTTKVADFIYDDLSRLTSAVATKNGQPVYNQAYDYNAIGNIMNKSDVGLYTYAGGIASSAPSVYSNPHAVTAAGAVNYLYDRRGNVTKINDNLTSKELTYDYNDDHIIFKNGIDGVRYGYDNSGNRVWKQEIEYFAIEPKVPLITNTLFTKETTTCTPISAPVRTKNTLIGKEYTIQLSSRYNYDEECRAIKSTGTETRYVGGFYEETRDKSTTVKGGTDIVKRLNIDVNGMQIATIETRPKAFPIGSVDVRTFFHHRDHLGSASIDTSGGNVTAVSDYLPFGTTLNDQNYDSLGYDNAYKFTGQELDDETGLYYYDARYYDSDLGRFMAVDGAYLGVSGDKAMLVNPQALNSYSYVLNNPLKYVDPSGNNFVDTWNSGMDILESIAAADGPALYLDTVAVVLSTVVIADTGIDYVAEKINESIVQPISNAHSEVLSQAETSGNVENGYVTLYRGDVSGKTFFVSKGLENIATLGADLVFGTDLNMAIQNHIDYVDNNKYSPFVSTTLNEAIAEDFAKGQDGNQTGSVYTLKIPSNDIMYPGNPQNEEVLIPGVITSEKIVNIRPISVNLNDND